MKFLLVGLFGLVGVYLRYFLDTHYSQNDQLLPISTFVANTIGCLIAGVVTAIVSIKGSHYLSMALLTGLCGGLTTFSGYNMQFLNLINQGQIAKGISFFLLGPVVGLVVIIIGYSATTYLNNSFN